MKISLMASFPFSAYFLSVPFWLYSTTLNIVLEVTWPISAKALVALFISVTQAGVLGRSNTVPGRKKKWFEWIRFEVDNSLVHMCEKIIRMSTVPPQTWPLLIMWWWSRLLLVVVQAPGTPTDVTRVIIDDRVIYSAPKGLTLRRASREILRCAANLLKKNKFWKWYGPLAVLINTQGIMDWWSPAEKPSVQGVSDRTENIWNWQLRRPVRHHHQIISMIILFIINIITFPNLWTPFSVASHLSHLNQTTVEAGHVFQTQTSEKYLVIFIIIPIQIITYYIQWLVIWTYFARHVLQIQTYENCPKVHQKSQSENVGFKK